MDNKSNKTKKELQEIKNKIDNKEYQSNAIDFLANMLTEHVFKNTCVRKEKPSDKRSISLNIPSN